MNYHRSDKNNYSHGFYNQPRSNYYQRQNSKSRSRSQSSLYHKYKHNNHNQQHRHYWDNHHYYKYKYPQKEMNSGNAVDHLNGCNNIQKSNNHWKPSLSFIDESNYQSRNYPTSRSRQDYMPRHYHSQNNHQKRSGSSYRFRNFNNENVNKYNNKSLRKNFNHNKDNGDDSYNNYDKYRNNNSRSQSDRDRRKKNNQSYISDSNASRSRSRNTKQSRHNGNKYYKNNNHNSTHRKHSQSPYSKSQSSASYSYQSRSPSTKKKSPNQSDNSSKKSSSNNKSSSNVVSDSDGKDRSKDAGHYHYTIGERIRNYIILKHLSDGTFGRVFLVENIITKEQYAMKVIRAVPRYIDSAKTEAEILMTIKQKENQFVDLIVQLQEVFDYKENYCMVFEQLGMSLYDVIKKNKYRGYSMYYVQRFFKQILQAVHFMHCCGLTHTDLKPENVLLKYKELVKVMIPAKRKGSSSHSAHKNRQQHYQQRDSTRSESEERKNYYYRPKSSQIKIIDFGGATYDSEHHSSIINTRQYRAPEVILECCEWDKSSDVWSIGCIILELYSGELYFSTHQNYEHLAMIEKSSGHIPYWMASKSAEFKNHFIFDNDYFQRHQTYFNFPKFAGQENINNVKNMRTINEIINSDNSELIDLLKKCLEIDPKKRINCKQALDHPFFDRQYYQTE